jgi:glycosyltransferase involved in cell wall biosynthesis
MIPDPLPSSNPIGRVAMYVFNDATMDSRVRREAASLASAGHTVTVLATARGGATTIERERVDGFEIVRIPIRTAWQARWRLISKPGVGRAQALAAARLTFAAGPVHWPTALGWVAVAAGWVGLSVIRRVALLMRLGGSREWPPANTYAAATWRWSILAWARDAAIVTPPADIYHGHDLTGLVAAVAAADRRGGLVVYDSHELFLESGGYARLPRWIRIWLRRLEQRLAARASAVVTVNPAIGAELKRRIPITRLAIVHNCPPRWEPPSARLELIRTATGIALDTPVLLYHGVFSAHRGLEQLAAAILEPGLETAHAVFLGYGAQRATLDRLAADPRFGGRLHVLDAVDPAVLLDWVTDADVAVIPGQPSTLNHLLSSPNKLFEAIAAGVPVAIMNFPYVAGIVRDDPDGPLGAICDPTDPAAIAIAVRSILELPAGERDALRARCLRAAHERWNWETESTHLMALVTDLLSSHH